MVKICDWCGRDTVSDRQIIYTKDIYAKSRTLTHLCGECYKKLREYNAEQIVRGQQENTEKWQNDVRNRMLEHTPV